MNNFYVFSRCLCVCTQCCSFAKKPSKIIVVIIQKRATTAKTHAPRLSKPTARTSQSRARRAMPNLSLGLRASEEHIRCTHRRCPSTACPLSSAHHRLTQAMVCCSILAHQRIFCSWFTKTFLHFHQLIHHSKLKTL